MYYHDTMKGYEDIKQRIAQAKKISYYAQKMAAYKVEYNSQDILVEHCFTYKTQRIDKGHF